jgi:PAS domain S-box-containing protein
VSLNSTADLNEVTPANRAPLWRDPGVYARLAQAVLLGLIVFALVWMATKLVRDGNKVSVICPENAVVLAVLLRSEFRRWPLLLAGSCVGFVASCSFMGYPIFIGCWSAFTNFVEILICAFGLRWIVGSTMDLARPRHLWIFIGLAGVAAPLASSAFVELSVSVRTGHLGGVPYILRWIPAHAMALLILTPALTILTPDVIKGLVTRRGGRTNLLLLMAYAVALALVYGQLKLPLHMILTPMLLVIAFRMELTGAALGGLMTSVAAGAGLMIVQSSVAQSGDDFAIQALVQEFNLLLLTTSALVMGATLAQRNRLKQSLAGSLAEAEIARVKAVEAERNTQLAELLTGVGHWRWECATNTLTWSPALFRLFSIEGLEKPSLDELERRVHPDDYRRVGELFERALATGEDYENIIRVLQPDGSWIRVMERGICERDEQGAVISINGASLDITKMHLADEAVRSSEAQYRLLAENSSDIILQTSVDGSATYVSPSIFKLTGYKAEELVGQKMSVIIDPEDWERVRAAIVALKAEGASGRWEGEYRIRHKDGRLLWFEARPQLVSDPETGEPLGFTDSIREITQRKTMEAELVAARDAAEAAAEAKAEFLANMSHEIRTPLTGIIGFSGLLEEVPDLSDTARLYVKRIVTAGRSLLSVVNDILDFSKLDARQVELDPHPFDPAGFIEDTVDLLVAQAENKGLSLDLRLDESIPSRVEADSSRLRQVLMNLINNAIKFTKEGGVTVSMSYEASAEQLRVEVADTGLGIEADKLDRLFQRFSQADGSINRSHGGTGLGLAICKGLVDLMGGDIGVTSVVGEGATFWFTILAPRADGGLVDKASEMATEVVFGDIAPAKILLVDDVSANRELVKAMLAPFGHEFVEACSGTEAVSAALGSKFDLIFMDLQMPGMDGLTATRIIRETSDINLTTPVIALSANVLSEHLEACAEAGMDDHMGKPIRPAELLSKVARWRNGRHAVVQPDIRIAS